MEQRYCFCRLVERDLGEGKTERLPSIAAYAKANSIRLSWASSGSIVVDGEDWTLVAVQAESWDVFNMDPDVEPLPDVGLDDTVRRLPFVKKAQLARVAVRLGVDLRDFDTAGEVRHVLRRIAGTIDQGADESATRVG